MTTPTIRCERVVKRYGGVLATDGVSLDLLPGEVLSVLGPSGSGKTTLLRLIAGFERLDGGAIAVQGRTVSSPDLHIPPEQRHVGMLFQEYALFPHLTVAENVSFGLRRLPAPQRRQRLGEVLDLVRLSGLERRYPHELSGGQQQRVALARTLAPRPVTLLLDEPFSNLDASMRAEMRREVAAILRANAASTVFVTHDRESAFAIADRVAVMRDGRFHQMDTPDAVYHRPATPFVARMCGTCDFLPARIRDGRAATEVGSLPWAAGTAGLGEGSPVELLVRVEDMLASPAHDGQGVVVEREFRGDEILLVVALPSGATVRCRARSDSTIGPGARVALFPATEAAFVAFQRDGSREDDGPAHASAAPVLHQRADENGGRSQEDDR